MSLIEIGFVLPEPFLLTTGIYDADPWLNLPSGIDVEYLLFDESSTGGRPSVFICSFIFRTYLMLIMIFYSRLP